MRVNSLPYALPQLIIDDVRGWCRIILAHSNLNILSTKIVNNEVTFYQNILDAFTQRINQ